MIQVKTFDDENELNEFLSTLKEEDIIKIDWKVFEDEEDYTEYFLVQYRLNKSDDSITEFGQKEFRTQDAVQ